MNKILYDEYTTLKARVKLLQEQQAAIGQQLYAAETELNQLKTEVDAAADDALLQSLI